MDMIYGFPHQGFQDPGQLLGCLIASNPYTRNYGPQRDSFFVNFGEAIEFGRPCPSGIKPFVQGFINPTFCFYGFQQIHQLVFVLCGGVTGDGSVSWIYLIILLPSGHYLLCPLPQVPPLYLLLVSTCCCPSSVPLWLSTLL